MNSEAASVEGKKLVGGWYLRLTVFVVLQQRAQEVESRLDLGLSCHTQQTTQRENKRRLQDAMTDCVSWME
jgi:hypothetical protein